jgi:hypothetical protein
MKKFLLVILCGVFAISCASNPTKGPGVVLDEARRNVVKEEYTKALDNYIWFFENSTKLKYSMWAVRLSVCLNEWRELGDVYEPALIKFRDEMSNREERLLKGEHNVYLFMEFHAFCQIDDKEIDAINVFLEFHKGKDKSFAKKIFSQIKHELLEFGYLDVCNEYVKDPLQELKGIKPLYSIDKEFYSRETIFLLTVLKMTGRDNEFDQVKIELTSYGLTEKIQNEILDLEYFHRNKN